uniref:BED-type domain-containing protein n=1 Tax=Amphimedon queenslandica TaxID=400682 RepID=A0A1X7SI36_AMPQE
MAAPTTDTEITEVEEIRLTEKRNTKVKVWKYFGLKLDENGKASDSENPVCRLCWVSVSAKYSNTSNLYSHFKNQHPEEYLE